MDPRKEICAKITVLLILLARGSPTLGLLETEYKDGFTYCSTIESSAIYFKDINFTQFREFQVRFHNITDDDYVCDLGDDRRCDPWWAVSDWKRTNSIENGFSEVLNDERWEDLEVHQLKDTYTELVSVDKATVILISWSIYRPAAFTLRSEEELDGSSYGKLRFKYNNITDMELGYYKSINRGIDRLFPKSNNAGGLWRNFVWSMKNGDFELKYLDDLLMKIDGFGPKTLYGRALGPTVFVKIQNYGFLRTEKAGFHQIGRPFRMREGSVCISLYVTMCKTCKMVFAMAGVAVAHVDFEEEDTLEKTWRNIVIEIKDSVHDYEQLYVSTIGNDSTNNKNNFWAIDYIKLCTVKRSIMIRGNYSCNFLYPKVPSKPTKYSHSLKDHPFPVVHKVGVGLGFFEVVSFENGTAFFACQLNNAQVDETTVKSACTTNATIAYPKLERCKSVANLICGSTPLDYWSISGSGKTNERREFHCSLFFFVNHSYVGTAYFSLEVKYGKYYFESAAAPDILEVREGRSPNDIKINFSHPFVGSRNLKGFEIKITIASHIQKGLKAFSVYWKIKEPNSTYNIVIDKFNYEYCTEYFIQIRAIQNVGLGYAATKLVVFLPHLPTIDIQKEERNTSIHFSIKIKASHNTCQHRLKEFKHIIIILLSENEVNHNTSKEIEELQKLLQIKFINSYRVLNKTALGSSEQKYEYQVDPDETRRLLFLEIISYGGRLKYFGQIFNLSMTHGGSDQKIRSHQKLFDVTYIVPLFMGIFVLIVLMCCCCVIRRIKKKSLLVRRPPTFDKIYFVADPVNQIDEVISETMVRIEEMLDNEYEVPLLPIQDSLVRSFLRSDSKPVRFADFEKYVRMSITSNALAPQFESLPVNLTKPCEAGQLECNKPKNRSMDILPYDQTRVKLQILDNMEGSDYINANYIKGYKNNKSFIAAQGPKSSTINDFWRMVWQENVRNIVMLVNLEESGVKKVEKYWPSYKEDVQFGNVHVYYHCSETLADYEIRVFRVGCGGSERKVFQYHYLNWTDNGVPVVFQSLVRFIRKTMEIHSKSPVLVHCCSGTSSTGVFILCHICLQMAHDIGIVDVLEVAKQLRDQRVNMIHDITQYKFAHLLILECLVGLQADITCNDDIDKLVAIYTDPDQLRLQLMYLEDLSWQYKALAEFPDYEPIFNVYPEKNRVPDIIPDVEGVVVLEKYPNKNECSSYINAIKVDRYQCIQKYIVTQQPMPNTLNDFWRMVIQQEVEVIISLNDINLKYEKSCEIWPTEENPEMSPVDFVIIKHCSTVENEIYDVIVVCVSIKDKERKSKSIKVTIVALKGWKPNVILPENVQNFLKFCGFVDSITRQLNNTVVICYDGCLASGIYVASSYLIEIIKVQKSFDVCNAIRVIRRTRKQFITEEKQLMFLYEVAATYIKGYQDYANFASCEPRCSNMYDYVYT